MDALRQFVEEGGETFQHLARENQEMLREMVDDWETYEEALTAVRDYLQDIFGDLGSTLTDALVDAFENGTDAANTFVPCCWVSWQTERKRDSGAVCP